MFVSVYGGILQLTTSDNKWNKYLLILLAFSLWSGDVVGTVAGLIAAAVVLMFTGLRTTTPITFEYVVHCFLIPLVLLTLKDDRIPETDFPVGVALTLILWGGLYSMIIAVTHPENWYLSICWAVPCVIYLFF